MHRFFTSDIADGTARITGDDVSHIARVLRMRVGDALTLLDGCGMEYEAAIDAIESSRVTCRVHSARPCPAEPRCRVTLFQALPKGDKLETILQKCTEIGLADAVLFTSKRCDVQVRGDYEKKLVRLRRVAMEACKQSGRGIVPEIAGPVRVSDIRPADYDLALLAYEGESEHSLKAALTVHRDAKNIAMLIGPEGGFEADEVAMLTKKGALPVSLGKRILRTETAGAAMLAQILYEVEA